MGFLDSLGHGASSLLHSAGDLASSAGHGIANVASDAYSGMSNAANAAGNFIHRTESGITSGLHSAEDWVDRTSHGLANRVQNVPVLGSLANGAADLVSMQAQITGGVLGGATSLVGGVANAVVHPIDTLTGLESMAEHIPGPLNLLRTGHDAIDVMRGKRGFGDMVNRAVNPMATMQEDGQYWKNVGSAVIDPYRQSWNEGRYGEVAGRGIFDIGSFLIGAGEANAAAHGAEGASIAARAASTAGRAGEAANVAHAAEAANVVSHAGEAANVVSHAGEAANVVTHASETAGTASRASEVAGNATRTAEEAANGARAPRLTSGPSGAGHVGQASPEAMAAYERIAATQGDTASIARSLGVDESVVQQVKQHLFHNEYDLPVVNEAENSVSMQRGRFTPDEGIADEWMRAQKGFEAGSPQDASFRRFLSHEYIESGLMSDGMPYKAMESFGEGRYGYYSYPSAEFHGAHDLAPATNASVEPFHGWRQMFGQDAAKPAAIAPDLSNIGDVLEQIRQLRGRGK